MGAQLSGAQRKHTKSRAPQKFGVVKMHRALGCMGVMVALTACAPHSQHSDKRCFHLHNIESAIGYCQAVRSGHVLQISGSVGRGAMADAIRMAYEELQSTLEGNGLTFRDVIKENVYTTDLDAFIREKAVRNAYYGLDFPAATWVQVQRLYDPTFVVEVELTAQIR
jgi:2-iminobutanoate/2-iminopropanoate deaminase